MDSYTYTYTRKKSPPTSTEACPRAHAGGMATPKRPSAKAKKGRAESGNNTPMPEVGGKSHYMHIHSYIWLHVASIYGYIYLRCVG